MGNVTIIIFKIFASKSIQSLVSARDQNVSFCKFNILLFNTVIIGIYEGSPRSTRPNKENLNNLEKNTFISQRSLLSARYTFPRDV